ncbi:MAG: VOC family protein [Planctomycetes bacterium]|nr:VOC family protein [Planctomycetota bacterium]
MSLPPFHLAIPVEDLAPARAFYEQLLGCGIGRESALWVDLDLHGHQVVLHQVEGARALAGHNPVDGDGVPVPHFGLVLPLEEWRALATRLEGHGVEFVIPPRVRFEGQAGEQHTMFLRDPSGNALEFKAFRDPAQLFAR